mgnify:CR=1 FL=1
MKSPLHIVMTPTRNEAWVIRAFLESTTRWADYIIFADQMSTDGTREIIQNYMSTSERAKIILIDNKNPNFNEHERQSMLVQKAREIAEGRDCLLWGLDADEILAADTFKTQAWQDILNSKMGSVFSFKWAELCPLTGKEKNEFRYWLSPTTSEYYPWLFHDDHKEPHGNYARNMHSMRIPYPIEEKLLFQIDDFRVLHLAYLNPYRVESKRRFYTFVDWEMNHRSPITLSRSYDSQKKKLQKTFPIEKEMLYSQTKDGFDILDFVDKEVKQCYMDEYIVQRLKRHDIRQLRRLDIWDSVFLQTYNLQDPRSWCDKLVHRYLKLTALHSKNFVVRVIDKVLKKIY